jgi:streptogrisin C
MNPRKAARVLSAVLIAAAMAVPFSLPVSAAPADATSATASPTDEIDTLNPGMLTALQRDLGLDSESARTLGAKQLAASDLENSLRTALGPAFGGAHFDVQSGKLVVGVTDAANAAEVNAAGATAKVVSRSAAQLDSAVKALDNRGSAAPAGVTSWYADTVTNEVVVTALPGSVEAAKSFAGAGARVVEVTEAPTTFADIKGGDAYNIGSSRCSVGMSVNGGFVTAGHCQALTGGGALSRNGVALGSWGGSSFPGNDYAWVRTNSNWTPRGLVGAVRVVGGTAAASGSAVCKSGSTTGWTCGTIGAKNQTVNYAQGSVSGLTASNVRCQPGDSGGGFITNAGQGQGVVSGGNSATCYFQPVGEILSRYGLTLVRG